MTQLLTAKELADMIKWPEKEIYRRKNEVPGRVEFFGDGERGRVRFRKDDIDAWIDAHTVSRFTLEPKPAEDEPDDGLREIPY